MSEQKIVFDVVFNKKTEEHSFLATCTVAEITIYFKEKYNLSTCKIIGLNAFGNKPEMVITKCVKAINKKQKISLVGTEKAVSEKLEKHEEATIALFSEPFINEDDAHFHEVFLTDQREKIKALRERKFDSVQLKGKQYAQEGTTTTLNNLTKQMGIEPTNIARTIVMKTKFNTINLHVQREFQKLQVALLHGRLPEVREIYRSDRERVHPLNDKMCTLAVQSEDQPTVEFMLGLIEDPDLHKTIQTCCEFGFYNSLLKIHATEITLIDGTPKKGNRAGYDFTEDKRVGVITRTKVFFESVQQTEYYNLAFNNGHLNIIRFLTTILKYDFKDSYNLENAVDRVVKNGHYHLLRYVHSQNEKDTKEQAIQKTGKHDQLHILVRMINMKYLSTDEYKKCYDVFLSENSTQCYELIQNMLCATPTFEEFINTLTRNKLRFYEERTVKRVGSFMGFILAVCPEFVNTIDFGNKILYTKPNTSARINSDLKTTNIPEFIELNEEQRQVLTQAVITATDHEEKMDQTIESLTEYMYQNLPHEAGTIQLICAYAYTMKVGKKNFFRNKLTEITRFIEQDLLILAKQKREREFKEREEKKLRDAEEMKLVMIDALLEEIFFKGDLLFPFQFITVVALPKNMMNLSITEALALEAKKESAREQATGHTPYQLIVGYVGIPKELWGAKRRMDLEAEQRGKKPINKEDRYVSQELIDLQNLRDEDIDEFQ